jgi:hypothetical protein
MKVHIELSYILKDEPKEFKTLELNHRSVYIWCDKRGYLNSQDPWIVFTRKSRNLSNNPNGIMEIWSHNYDTTDPPKQTDDMWTESYKTLIKKNHVIEWHPTISLLRVIWVQSMETLQQNKVLVPIISSLEEFNLDYPGAGLSVLSLS